MNKVLVVDDELSIRESFSLILEGKHKVLLAASGEGALKTAADQKVDVVFLDIRMPGLDGLETLKRLKEIDPDLEIIMVTAVNEVQKASEAIKLGARDYIVKPFDVNAVLKMTDSLLRRKSLLREGEEIQKEAQKKVPQLVGQSDKIVEINKNLGKIAAQEQRVLVLGEPGTEKETVARLIHENGPRAAYPFRAFRLSPEIPPAETKTRLFGTGKGSTTADLTRETGLFEEARGGTVFLDQVENLPADVLKSPVEVRLVGGSSQNVESFSEVSITLPPLRERISDLPLLINHFLEKFSAEYGKEVTEVAPEAMEALSNYPWPGNTAELACLLKRLVLTAASNRIAEDQLPIDILLKGAGAPGSEYLSTFENDYVKKIFAFSKRDKEKAAALLGISPALLEGKI